MNKNEHKIYSRLNSKQGINKKNANTGSNKLEIKTFINGFNFPFPDWKSLPSNFPYCDTQKLSKEEEHLYGAIKLAWVISVGRGDFYRNIAKKSILIVGTIIIFFLVQNIITNPKSPFSKAVNAATVSATLRGINIDEVVESTMSAVYGYKPR